MSCWTIVYFLGIWGPVREATGDGGLVGDSDMGTGSALSRAIRATSFCCVGDQHSCHWSMSYTTTHLQLLPPILILPRILSNSSCELEHSKSAAYLLPSRS